ncbi:RNA polymerase sigma-70 factor [Paraflavitalea sp. CAU 1676]|uniref:RNA polymerase sigma-70 factor n=1 Tax=Paraflavitalea sp. CAU 1676 TaxID=3032598 RepID=UPI0023DA582F|nr:RNA polymerase sigma-70 factor [Paraflavitalea sp. CAU 1676]MDF2188894.1 RNA polymerase sigma-70 factor [Paraflavitalea sp. CAU 1676]
MATALRTTLYSSYSDEQLVGLLRDNDEEAFAEIYHRYWDKLLAIGFHHARNKEVAEEIVQDVLLSLWNRRHSMEIDRPAAWLATAVKFAVFKTLARENRRKDLLQGHTASTDTDVTQFDEELLAAKFLKEYLDGLVSGLPEQCRLVFVYSRDHQLSTKEIAETLNLSTKTVESHLTKALKTLRHLLGNYRFFSLAAACFHIFLKKI